MTIEPEFPKSSSTLRTILKFSNSILSIFLTKLTYSTLTLNVVVSPLPTLSVSYSYVTVTLVLLLLSSMLLNHYF